MTPQRTRVGLADGNTVRARLRDATADLHARVDGLFPNGLDSLHAYRRYLLGMHRFAADHEFATVAMPRLSCWLAHDLSALQLPPLPAQGVRAPLASQDEKLGWDYVMAGSSRGARQLVRDARKLGIGEDSGSRFLERHAAGKDWPHVQARMEALDGADARIANAEIGARDAFALVRDCFERSFACLPSADAQA